MNQPQNQNLEKPEHFEIPISEIQQRPKIEFAGHNWKQRGTYVECASCPVSHGFFVPPDVKFSGLDENGMPILKRI